MREVKYVFLFVIGILIATVLFRIADGVNPHQVTLNHVLLGVTCLCWGLLVYLFYKDTNRIQ